MTTKAYSIKEASVKSTHIMDLFVPYLFSSIPTTTLKNKREIRK